MSTQGIATPDRTPDKPPRPRRWIPLSLRLFVVIVLVLPIVGVAWIGIRAHSQSQTIRSIERLGGWVVTHPTAPDWLAQHSPSAAQWLDQPNGVYVIADEGYDDRYWHMNRFSYGLIVPDSPNFHATRIADADVSVICKLKRLSTLLLSGSDLTDAGVRAVSELHDLWYLSLAGSQITDDGLDNLSRLPHLAYLSLEDTLVTDVGISRLADLPNLRSLLLDGTRVTDAGIMHLAKYDDLYLSVRRTQVSEAGVDALHEKSISRLRNQQNAPLPIFSRIFVKR